MISEASNGKADSGVQVIQHSLAFQLTALKGYRFVITLRWVNYNRIFFYGYNNTLSFVL